MKLALDDISRELENYEKIIKDDRKKAARNNIILLIVLIIVILAFIYALLRYQAVS